jgi:putative spermidine/putrescine transport system ATP-binding protein
MSVRKNIGFGLKMRGVAKAELDRRVEEAVNLVRLQGHVDKLPGQLSGGQQQRVAIARAIVVEPPLVLMDEPLSNLDAKLRLEMRAEIRRIHNTLGATTIYVTHDQEEALSLADRIVVMREGEVRQVGTPEDLYARPEHLDVAEFMGFRNRIAGRISAVSGNTATLDVRGTTLSGTMRKPLNVGDAAVLAIRPDDLRPTNGGIPATVVSTEYRGQEFVGFARSAESDLSFLSDHKLEPGKQVTLGADPTRVLVYGGKLA